MQTEDRAAHDPWKVAAAEDAMREDATVPGKSNDNTKVLDSTSSTRSSLAACIGVH